MAAGNDRCRVRTRRTCRPENAGSEPMVELGFWKQPAAGDLRARHRSFRHHFIDLALLEAEIGGFLGGCEQLHDASLHLYAPFLRMHKTVKITRDCSCVVCAPTAFFVLSKLTRSDPKIGKITSSS